MAVLAVPPPSTDPARLLLWLRRQKVTPFKIFLLCCVSNASLCAFFRLRFRHQYASLLLHSGRPLAPNSSFDRAVSFLRNKLRSALFGAAKRPQLEAKRYSEEERGDLSPVLVGGHLSARRAFGASSPDSKTKLEAVKPKTSPSSSVTEPPVSDFRRLVLLLRISIGPKQACLFALHAANLFLRSWLSIQISHLYGHVTAMVVENDWESFLLFCSRFLLFSGASTLVNAGLRFGEEYISESMVYRLGQTLHMLYLRRRNYYKLAKLENGNLISPDAGIGNTVTSSSNGGSLAAFTISKREFTIDDDSAEISVGGALSRSASQQFLNAELGHTANSRAASNQKVAAQPHIALPLSNFNADKRISEDTFEFSHQVVHLFGHTLKPVFDVVMSSLSLFQTLGPRSPSLLYAYFVFTGLALAAQAPPFASLLAAEQGLHNDFLQAHSRVVSHAEEIAFLGGEREEYVRLDTKLKELLHFKTGLRTARWRQNLLDQWMVKYCASIVGMSAISFPLIAKFQRGELTKSELIGRHRTADNLIRHAAGAVGEIILVYHQINALSGFGLRLGEIFEKTSSLKNILNQGTGEGMREWVREWINVTKWWESGLILVGKKEEFPHEATTGKHLFNR